MVSFQRLKLRAAEGAGLGGPFGMVLLGGLLPRARFTLLCLQAKRAKQLGVRSREDSWGSFVSDL